MNMLESYDHLHITWKIIDQIENLLFDTDCNIHNRTITKRYAKKYGYAELIMLLERLAYYDNAKHVWAHIVCDIENGFQMPYIQMEATL